MKKLRQVIDRTDDHGHEADLRGLGKEDIFLSSFPYCVLVLSHEPKSVTHILSKYNLKLEHIDDKYLILPHHKAAGEHTVQALKLYFCSLELIHLDNDLHCSIHEVRSLHHEIHKAARNTKDSPFSVHALIKQATENLHKHHLSIEASCSLYLLHSGIVMDSDKDQHFSFSEVKEKIKTFQNKKEKTRKSA